MAVELLGVGADVLWVSEVLLKMPPLGGPAAFSSAVAGGQPEAPLNSAVAGGQPEAPLKKNSS